MKNNIQYATLLVFLATLISANSFSQQKVQLEPKDILTNKTFSELPYNEQSKKVSIVEVVNIKNATQEDIYKRIFDWYQSRSTTITQPSDFSKKNDPNGKGELAKLFPTYGVNPASTLVKSYEKISFYFQVYNLKDIKSLFGPKEMSGIESGNLTILIKDGRIKLEATDFIHTVQYVRSQVYDREGIMFVYESKKVDFSDKNWNSLRLEGLNKTYQILVDFVNYIQKNPSGNMDF